MRMQLTLSAEKLKNMGGTFRDRVSDPYAEVIINGGKYEGTVLGRTETIKNNLNPVWTTVLFVDVDEQSSYMPFRVTIMDDNDGKRDDVVMAEANFVDVLSVHSNDGHMGSVYLRDGGVVRATITKSIKGTDKGIFDFQLRGLDIKNVELGVLQLGVSDPYFEIKKKSADHAAGVVQWYEATTHVDNFRKLGLNLSGSKLSFVAFIRHRIPVYRSETIMDNLNPFWEPVQRGMEALCFCDANWPLMITVMDWQRNGKHREIGSVETTVSGIKERVTKRDNANRENALILMSDDKTNTRGVLVVISANVKKVK